MFDKPVKKKITRKLNYNNNNLMHIIQQLFNKQIYSTKILCKTESWMEKQE